MAPEGATTAGTTSRLGRRLVVFSAPFQGHINPIFQLATLLFRRGFSITVVHTKFNAPDPSSYPDFRFAPIDDGLGEGFHSDDLVLKPIAINVGCRGPFRDCLSRLLEEAGGEGEDPVAGLVVDAMLFMAEAVAEELGVPRVVVRTSSAACLHMFCLFPTLWNKGYYPLQGDRGEEEVPEAPPYRVKDLVRFPGSSDENLRELMTRALQGIRTAAALVLNTFEELEPADLAALRRHLPPPIFPVGPLHKFSRNAPNSSLLEQDRSCMEWLDRQLHGSVIYVSFGSLAFMEREQLAEVAWGLAGSRQPFLWVVRPGSVRGPGAAELPAEFADETRGRGMVVSWAPQPEVLAHPAVGGFWTHCGWNSILEALCEGVPMLCRPYFGDQTGNARYVSHVWKVGLVLEGALIEREEVERAVRTLMVEEEGVEMRERAREIKEKAAGPCKEEGGSSCESLYNLVDFILSLSC